MRLLTRDAATGLPKRTLWAEIFVFLSGSASLVHEVLWARWFGTAFGNTVTAPAAVFSTCLAGFALGALFFGRVSDRVTTPVRIFPTLEVATGLLTALVALTLPLTLRWIAPRIDPAETTQFSVRYGVFVVAFAVLFTPAMLIGGTLPAALQWGYGSSPHVGSAVGYLRAANCLGAAAGAMLGASPVIPLAGLRLAGLTAASLNICIGLMAFLVGKEARNLNRATRNESVRSCVDARRSAFTSRSTVCAVLGRYGVGFAALLSGALAMSVQISHVRALSFYMGSTARSFAIVSAVWITGLGIGSLISAVFLRRSRERATGYWLVIALAFSALWTAISPRLIALLGPSGHPRLATIMASTPVAVSLGSLTPCFVHMWNKRGEAAPAFSTGIVFGMWDIGGICGPVVTSLVLLPRFGTVQTLEGLAVTGSAVGVVIA
ncbi:MAG: fused MFS/spermidine synthase, partial [Kiritimatiellae bacterium]|nr:fused MFS/spermidine synthase [Kiritimatiellia bacterium]